MNRKLSTKNHTTLLYCAWIVDAIITLSFQSTMFLCTHTIAIAGLFVRKELQSLFYPFIAFSCMHLCVHTQSLFIPLILYAAIYVSVCALRLLINVNNSAVITLCILFFITVLYYISLLVWHGTYGFIPYTIGQLCGILLVVWMLLQYIYVQ